MLKFPMYIIMFFQPKTYERLKLKQGMTMCSQTHGVVCDIVDPLLESNSSLKPLVM
jgi:hypothetical protein